MGSKKGSSTTTTTSTPWTPQAEGLTQIFGEAGNIYDAYRMNYYEGPYTAGLNDTQRTALQQQLAAAGAAGNFADTTLAQSQRLSGAYDASLGITQSLAGGDPVAQALRSGDPIAQELARRALEDPTQGILQTAGQYADNPYITGMIDSVGRDIDRNLTERDLISLNLGASGMGNMNSSRAGAAEAILMRGAQDRLGDISSGIRMDAWNNGLTMAQAQRESMFRNGLAASGQDINTRLAASQQDINTRLAAAQNFNALGAVGTGLGSLSLDMRTNQAGLTANVGNTLQGEEQRQIQENMRQFEAKESQDWNRLGNYYGIVGDKSWGGTQTQTAPKTGGSGLQTALGAAMVVGGVIAAPYTGGASLALVGAGAGMAAQGLGGGGGGFASTAPQAYGGGGYGGGRQGYRSPFGMSYSSGNLNGTDINQLPAGITAQSSGLYGFAR